jgi:hypothetical protein
LKDYGVDICGRLAGRVRGLTGLAGYLAEPIMYAGRLRKSVSRVSFQHITIFPFSSVWVDLLVPRKSYTLVPVDRDCLTSSFLPDTASNLLLGT